MPEQYEREGGRGKGEEARGKRQEGGGRGKGEGLVKAESE